MARVTRGSVAKEQAAQASSVAAEEPVQLSSPPETPKSTSTRKKASPAKALPVTPKGARKRSRLAVKEEDNDINDPPHNLGKIPNLTPTENDSPPAKKSRKRNPAKNVTPKEESIQDLVGKATGLAEVSPKGSKKPKKEKDYGVVHGVTPYPNWAHPTHEECEEVNSLLSSVHGEVKAPKAIPPPSLDVAGCGEVPSILDAIVRTILSAHTTRKNAGLAFAGIVKEFGVLKEGVGKGSVDYNNVRISDTERLKKAIHHGGCAPTKSKQIKKLVQSAWEENQARREELITSGATLGLSNEGPEEKHAEVAKAEANVLSLDHIHLLSTEDAFRKLIKYDGVGAKTASCILLFCMQRPSFAVDTHVYRLCGWLGWVPPPGHPDLLAPGKKGNFVDGKLVKKKGDPVEASRDTTFAHCDVRVPDHLKYSLHQLLIRHGSSCPRCRAATGEKAKGYEDGCVIDHLMKRTGVRKGPKASPAKGVKGTKASPAKGAKSMAARRQAKKAAWEDDNEFDTSELTELEDDFEDEDPVGTSPAEEEDEDSALTDEAEVET